MIRLLICFLFFSIIIVPAKAQIEHVPVAHPVYYFLIHTEAKGLLPNFSTSALPLTRLEITIALKKIRKNSANLSNAEISTLSDFETEFELNKRNNAVIIYSKSDSVQVLSKRFFSNNEKFIYHYKDSSSTANISPLGSIESIIGKSDTGKIRNVQYGNLGIRLFGTIDNMLGYYLQATNGAIIHGDRQLAKEELHKLQQNIKFTDLNSDFDFSESHVRFQKDWFYAIIGRETQLLGSGINQRLILSDNAPPMDKLSLGVKFSDFEYRFTHGSLLATVPKDSVQVGFNARIPSKFVALHRFSIKPSCGEISYWESTIYSDRGVDLAYLNPLSFLKSIEHALHDRDNGMMGIDYTVRIINGIQLKGSYLLDDLIFGKIGKGYWANKSAWNSGIMVSLPANLDVGFEYARVEPYTFTHFDSLNPMTNDNMLYGTNLLPNSEETSMLLQYWWGNRYPIIIRFSYQRHGKNIYDSNGNLIKNVGGDPFQTRRYPVDSETVTFLDGIRENIYKLQFEYGWEIIRGFNLHLLYQLRSVNNDINHSLRLIFRYEDF